MGDDDNDKKVLKKVKDIDSLIGRFDIKPAEGKFVIERATEDDAGNYTCSLFGETKIINVVGKISIGFSSVKIPTYFNLIL